MTILIIVSSGLAAILTALFAIHKAGKARIANIVVTIILILFITGYSAVQEWKKERTRQTLLNDTYHRLFSVSQDLMALVRDATVQASDGWVPSNTSDLCSERVAALLCNRFDLSKGAPVIPPRAWLDYFASETKRDRAEIEAILSTSGPNLDSHLIDLLIHLKGSDLLGMPEQLVGAYAIVRQRGWAQPQTLCPMGIIIAGPEKVDSETLMLRSLQSLKAVYEQMLVLTNESPVSMPSDYEALRMDLGKARVSDEAIKKWESELSESEKIPNSGPKGHFIPIKP